MKDRVATFGGSLEQSVMDATDVLARRPYGLGGLVLELVNTLERAIRRAAARRLWGTNDKPVVVAAAAGYDSAAAFTRAFEH